MRSGTHRRLEEVMEWSGRVGSKLRAAGRIDLQTSLASKRTRFDREEITLTEFETAVRTHEQVLTDIARNRGLLASSTTVLEALESRGEPAAQELEQMRQAIHDWQNDAVSNESFGAYLGTVQAFIDRTAPEPYVGLEGQGW